MAHLHWSDVSMSALDTHGTLHYPSEDLPAQYPAINVFNVGSIALNMGQLLCFVQHMSLWTPYL